MDQIIDYLDVAAKRYPIKKLAFELDKGESTLRNELTQQPGYKLGLITALNIMKKTVTGINRNRFRSSPKWIILPKSR